LLVIARLVPNEERELDEAISGRDPSSKSLRPGRIEKENFTLILRQAQDERNKSSLPRQRRVAFGDLKEGVRGKGKRFTLTLSPQGRGELKLFPFTL